MKQSFQDYFRELIGETEAEAFFNTIETKETRRGLRVNTLKTTKLALKEWLESQGYTVSDSPFSRDGLEIEGRGERLALKLPYHAGFTYPQDPSSMYAVELLDPQPGEVVIDLTAAPGGKTTHIAQRMENTGVLFANDMDTRRLKALHSNLERLGIWNCVVTRMEPYKLSLMYTETFDRVLIDPSCSGEGLLVTHDGKPSHWNTKALKRYMAEQFGLLCSAFRLLKPGGRLVYSTCTLNDKEDDGVVKKLLKKFPQAQIEQIEVPGTPEQLGDLMGTRFWPHKTQTKGFFCIAITKTETLGLDNEKEANETLKPLKAKQLQEFKLPASPKASFVLRNDYLFAVSEALTRFPLPRHYSLSFPLMKDGEPSHAGALWMAQYGSSHELNYEETRHYFEDGVLEFDGEGDFTLIKYKRFPLGFASKYREGFRAMLPKQH
jgi:NOL1/NOP2/sun family putative RNA methylase